MAGRRLFELLREQQEPFLLDVNLLERGFCSSDAAFKSWGLKRLLKKPLDWVRRSSAGCWSCSSGEADSQQFSPVSVLELPSSNSSSSPVHHHPLGRSASGTGGINESTTVGFDLPRKVVHIFNELIEVAAANMPVFDKLPGSKRQLHRPDELIILGSQENDADKKSRMQEKIPPPWEWQKHSTVAENLIISDLSSCDAQWSGISLHQVEEFAVEIEAALFECIKDETILEMIGPRCALIEKRKHH